MACNMTFFFSAIILPIKSSKSSGGLWILRRVEGKIYYLGGLLESELRKIGQIPRASGPPRNPSPTARLRVARGGSSARPWAHSSLQRQDTDPIHPFLRLGRRPDHN